VLLDEPAADGSEQLALVVAATAAPMDVLGRFNQEPQPEPELDLENMYVFIQVPTDRGELRSFCTKTQDAELDDSGKVHLGPFIILERERHISAISAMDRHVSALEREHEEHCEALREMYMAVCHELVEKRDTQLSAQLPAGEHEERAGAPPLLGRTFGAWHTLTVLSQEHQIELQRRGASPPAAPQLQQEPAAAGVGENCNALASQVESMRDGWLRQAARRRRRAAVESVFAAWRFHVALSRTERAHKATLDRQAADSLAQHRALMDAVSEAELRHRGMLELQMEVMQHAQKQSARAVALAAYSSQSQQSGSDAGIDPADALSVDSSPTSDSSRAHPPPADNEDRRQLLTRIRVLTDELQLDQEAHKLELDHVKAACEKQLASMSAELAHVNALSANQLAELRTAELELERERAIRVVGVDRVERNREGDGDRPPASAAAAGAEESPGKAGEGEGESEGEAMAVQGGHSALTSRHHGLQLSPAAATAAQAAAAGAGLEKPESHCSTEERLRSLLKGMEAWEVSELVTQALQPPPPAAAPPPLGDTVGDDDDDAGMQSGSSGSSPAVRISYHVSSSSSQPMAADASSVAAADLATLGQAVSDGQLSESSEAERASAPPFSSDSNLNLQQAIPGWMRRPRDLLKLDELEMGRVICALSLEDAEMICAEEGIELPQYQTDGGGEGDAEEDDGLSLDALHRQLLQHYGCELPHTQAEVGSVGVAEEMEEGGEEDEEETPRSAAATARLKRLLTMEPPEGEVLLLSPLTSLQGGAGGGGAAEAAEAVAAGGGGEGVGHDNADAGGDRRHRARDAEEGEEEAELSPPSQRSPVAEQRRLALLSMEPTEDEVVILMNPHVERLSSAEPPPPPPQQQPVVAAAAAASDAAGAVSASSAANSGDDGAGGEPQEGAPGNPTPPPPPPPPSDDDDWLSGSGSDSLLE
jgi:hypothetical protein